MLSPASESRILGSGKIPVLELVFAIVLDTENEFSTGSFVVLIYHR